jgi:protoporphyrinogen oxidase
MHGARPAQKHIGIIGGGFAGLTAAYRLVSEGHRATVFERSRQLGGLAMSYPLCGTRLEKYYHHLFTSDKDILALARELGVEVTWPSPPVGMFTGGVVHPFTTPADLLRFSPLSPADRVRLAAVALFLQRFPNGRRFEGVTAAEWYRRYAGPRVYTTIIGPMLRAKFGRNAEKVAMVWMWGKLRLRGTSREKGGLKESLGYVRGSFGALIDRLADEIRRRGGEVRGGAVVRRIEGGTPSRQLTEGGVPGFVSALRPSPSHPQPAASWSKAGGQPLFVITDRDRVQVDAVLSTIAPELLADVVPDLPAAWRATARTLSYSGVLCTTLVLRHQLSPIYWMYISDVAVPFGGLIEHTNYIPPSEYGGSRILYVSHYMYPDEEFYTFASEDIMRRYVPHLKRVNPGFDESWIEKRVFAHDRFAQPIVEVDYAERLLPYVTPIPGIFSASMAQIFPEDRGTNYAVLAGNQVAAVIREYLHNAG